MAVREESVRATQLRMIASSRVTLLGAAITVALTVAVLWPYLGRPLLLAWAVAIAGITAGRLALWQRFQRIAHDDAAVVGWAWQLTSAITMIGILWGLFGVRFYLVPNIEIRGVVLLILASMLASGTIFYSAYLPAHAGYVLGCTDFRWAATPEERSKLWQARHDSHYSAMARRPGARVWATDVCVPISRLAECIAETRADIQRSDLMAGMLGHVGDGNFHVRFPVDPQRPKEIAEARRLNERPVARAISMDGTCTGEHGVGLGKMDFLLAEHGDGVGVMRALKKALDPDNILNPGKIVRV